jgi:biotin carboxyl carrier protein
LEAFAAELYAGNGTRHPEPVEGPSEAATPSPEIRVEVNDKLYRVRLIDLPPAVSRATGAPKAAPRIAHKKRAVASTGNDVVSPMHGVVVEIAVRQGASVAQGQVVAVVEAMKMMNEIRAHKAGTASAIHVAAGDTVEAQSPLVTIE